MPTLVQEVTRLVAPLPMTEIGLIQSEAPGLISHLEAEIALLEAAIGDSGKTCVVPESVESVFPSIVEGLENSHLAISKFSTIGAVVGRMRPEFDDVTDPNLSIDSNLSLVMYDYDRGIMAASMDDLKRMEDGSRLLKVSSVVVVVLEWKDFSRLTIKRPAFTSLRTALHCCRTISSTNCRLQLCRAAQ